MIYAPPSKKLHRCVLLTPINVTSYMLLAFVQGKGMERILRQEEEEAAAAAAGTAKTRRRRAVVYLGDGRGDYCPSLKLREGDYVMPRAGHPVCDLIAASPPAAAVRGWAGFEDLARVLLGIVDGEIARAAAAAEEDAGAAGAGVGVGVVVVPADCRAPLPLPARQEALMPQAVRVPN
jgi:pyridoxal phosphate phosphatase PHOSPHO2